MPWPTTSAPGRPDVPARIGLPLWLKLAFSAWIVVWAPTYAFAIGPQNFFWLCNVANFLILAGLWTESRRLLSMQLLSVLLVGVGWTIDVGTAVVAGFHPIGGTEYMLDENVPLALRSLSLYHVILPVVAVYAVARLGYDRGALAWQSVLTWVMIPLSWFLTDAERNINWVHQPFNQTQDLLGPIAYLVVLMLLWPLVIYLPTHLLVLAVRRRRSAGRRSDRA